MKIIIAALLCVPAFASPITYGLDARSTSLTFAGSFTVDDGALTGLDILGGGVEWTLADSFSVGVGSQSLSASTCTPVGVNCYSALAKIYTLWLNWDGNGAAHGVFDVTFPGDAAEFQYTVTGSVTQQVSVGQAAPLTLAAPAAVHNPEPGTWWMLAGGVCVMMVPRLRILHGTVRNRTF